MVLSPGGVAVILLLPAVGILISRVDARYLISLGFLIIPSAFFISAGSTSTYLLIKPSGPASFRLPVSPSSSFRFKPWLCRHAREKSNAISGMTNLYPKHWR